MGNHWSGAQKWGWRLFIKNTGVCEVFHDDVYALTPARCWKVKERGESFEPKPQ